MTGRRTRAARPDAGTWSRLRSYTDVLYEEMDKLSKKAPSSRLSDLATQRVNRAIHEAKELMAVHDPYIADLVQFVPAGDNPEVRDAVLVLGEIKAALERLNSTFELEEEPL